MTENESFRPDGEPHRPAPPEQTPSVPSAPEASPAAPEARETPPSAPPTASEAPVTSTPGAPAAPEAPALAAWAPASAAEAAAPAAPTAPTVPAASEASAQEASVPEASVPEASVPEASVPEASEASAQEASVPAASASEASAQEAPAPAAQAGPEPMPYGDAPTAPQPIWAGHAAPSPWAQPGPYAPGPYAPGPPGPPMEPGQPGQPGQPAFGVPPQRKPNRVGKAVAIGAAAVVLALTSGTIGAGLALGLNQAGVVRVTETREAAPVVDRSSLAEIAANVQPSVVSVKTGSGEGSGVVLSEDGYVLTNNHVVSGARSLTVTFSNGKNASATVVGTDAKTDLAVLKADATGLTPAKFGNSDDMRVGDTVLALGSPLGLEGSVTAGIVSAVDRTIQAGGDRGGSPFEQPSAVSSISGVIQTDAAINPGNSGGALVNLEGELIGINTAIATAGSGNGNIGVGFAIPGNKAKQVAEQLRKGEKVSHAFLGVQVQAADAGGAEVTTVTSGSPAASVGFKQGDVITKVGDTTITDSDDLVSAIQSRKPGDRVEITYTRAGSQQTTTVTLGEAS